MGVSMRVFSVAMVLALLPGAVAQAQRPPKYVRTPYAEVYRDPWGGKHIRTPFVEIHKPGRVPPGYVGPYPFPPPVMPEGAVRSSQPRPDGAQVVRRPTPAVDFGQLDYQALAQTIRESNERLGSDLARSRSGAFWQASLKTNEIALLVPADAAGPPDESVREQLQEIVRTMQGLSGDPEGSSVVRLGSFRNLLGALREYTLPPDVRSRGQLYSAAAELDRSLEQFGTATTWQRYFALTRGSALAPDQRTGESAQPTPDLATLLDRFESASQDPQYSMIAALPAFARTHELLRAYVFEHLANEGAPKEELPAPRPDEVRLETLRR